MRVCVAQIRVEDGIEHKKENMQRVVNYVHQAAKQGCELVVFPECVLGGFKDTRQVAEPIDGEFITTLRVISAERNIAIAGTFGELDGDNVYDTAFFVQDGNVYFYRKNVLFIPGGEHKLFSPGRRPPKVFEWNGWKIGMSICYELRFPELFLGLVKSGVELLIIPAAWMAPRRVSDWEALIPARAVETQAYVIAANRVGGKFFGRSAIAGPSGEVYRAGRNEGLYSAEIYRERIEETRSRIPAVETRRKMFDVKITREEPTQEERVSAVSSA